MTLMKTAWQGILCHTQETTVRLRRALLPFRSNAVFESIQRGERNYYKTMICVYVGHKFSGIDTDTPKD